MFRNIIWDVDGTLFDTYPTITRAIKSGLNDLGKDEKYDFILELAKHSLNYCNDVLAEKYQLDKEILAKAVGKLYEKIRIEENPPFSGVMEVCKFIHSIHGKNVIVTHRGRNGTESLLMGHGLADLFSGCISRDDGFMRKPDPAAFEAAISNFQLHRNETLTVGDREIDIQAGKAAGLFRCLYGSTRDCTKADLVIDNYEALLLFLTT
jgi:HAD superfamily hydrolase (TIGR01509 family)